MLHAKKDYDPETLGLAIQLMDGLPCECGQSTMDRCSCTWPDEDEDEDDIPTDDNLPDKQTTHNLKGETEMTTNVAQLRMVFNISPQRKALARQAGDIGQDADIYAGHSTEDSLPLPNLTQLLINEKAAGSNADVIGKKGGTLRAGRGRVPEDEADAYWIPKMQESDEEATRRTEQENAERLRLGGSALVGTPNPPGYDGRNLATLDHEEEDESLGESDDHQNPKHGPEELKKKKTKTQKPIPTGNAGFPLFLQPMSLKTPVGNVAADDILRMPTINWKELSEAHARGEE
jgi:hypothetical protein